MKEAAARTIAVRVLGTPEAGGRSLALLEQTLRTAWRTMGPLDVRVAAAGDDARSVQRTLRRWCDRERADVVLTVGRAGHLQRDFVPELTAALIERPLPGIEERMCLAPPLRPEGLLFRGRAGFRKATLVVNLPGRLGRARAIVRMLAPVVGHALEKARGGDGECGRAVGEP